MIRVLFFWIFVCVISINSPNILGSSLIGYWHNWNDANAPYIQLDSIADQYDYIVISFAIPTSNNDMTMLFTPDIITQNEFISKVQSLKNRGKKVLLSVGGATSVIDLTTQDNRNSFVNSLTNLISTYGFDGLDIDIEHGNSILITGGTIINPTNTAQINLIDAVKTIMSNFRTSYSKKMLLTITPETAYVQGGQSGFGNIWGAYLPIIHALRDSLDVLQVQLYNSGTMYGLDGNIYTQGTADFIIAMTEAVIRGFNTNGGFFQGIPADKVCIGLPASTSAAGGGFTDTAIVSSAINYLLGKTAKPGNYTMIESIGYPSLRGMMTWSINWDAILRYGDKYQYARNYSNIFKGTVPEKVTLIAPSNNSIQSRNVNFIWRHSIANSVTYHLNIYQDDNLIISDSAITDSSKIINNLTPGSFYSWKVRAKNNIGWGEWSDTRDFNILAVPSKISIIYPSHNELIKQKGMSIRWKKSTPQVTHYQIFIESEGSIVTLDSSIIDTNYVINLLPDKIYDFRIRARNISGWGEWSETVQFSTISLPLITDLVLPEENQFISTPLTNFIWNKSIPNVNFYHIEIYRDLHLEKSDSTIADTSYYYDNLINQSEYSWKVRSKNSFGWSNWSDTRKFTYLMLPGTALPINPQKNSIIQDDTILFVWNSVSNNPRFYHLEISKTGNIFFSDSTLTDTTFTLSSLEFDKEYYWRVKAKNSSGWGEWSETWNFSIISPQIDLPNIVNLATPAQNSFLNDTIAIFTWFSSKPQVTNYKIEISKNNYMFFYDSTLTDTTYIFPSLEFDKEYSWRVKAKNSSGWGEWSETWKFSIDNNTDIEENASYSEQLFISPNPASEFIEINFERCATLSKCGTSEGNEIKMYNTFGEILMSTSVNFVDTSAGGGQIRIDISHLPVGLYFIQIGNYTERFVVVR